MYIHEFIRAKVNPIPARTRVSTLLFASLSGLRPNYPKLKNRRFKALMGSYFIFVFFTLIMVFNMLTMSIFPVAGVDESWQSSNAYSLFNKNFVSINYPFFQQNYGAPYTMNLLLGLVYKIFGVGLLQGRFTIFLLSLALLIVFYLFVKEFFGRKVALLGIVYLASTRSFFLSSHFIRNDIPFSLIVLLSLWSFLRFLKSRNYFMAFLSGLIMSYSTDLHQNGVFFCIALSACSLFVTKRSVSFLERAKGFLSVLIGYILYILYYFWAHILPNTQLFISERTYSYTIDHSLPILSMSLKDMLAWELNRYISYFFPARIPEALLLLASVIWSCRQKDIFVRTLFLFIIIPMVLFFPFSSNKSDFYLINFFPLLAIVLALFFVEIKKRLINFCVADRKRVFFRVSFFLFFIILVGFNYMVQIKIVYDNKEYNYSKVLSLIGKTVPSSSLILGPTNYWLPLHDYKYRSIYTLSWFRTINKISLTNSLEEIKPDYILIDSSFDGMLVDDTAKISDRDFKRGLYNLPRSELLAFLNNRGNLILDYTYEFYGRLKLYEVDWKKQL